MKKLFSSLFFIFLLGQSFAQGYVAEGMPKDDLVASKVSGGISPIVFLAINEYNEAPGMGLEFNLNYAINNNFSVGSFLRLKAMFSGEVPIPGQGYDDTFMEDGALAFGALVEYKVFNRLGIHLKGGYEELFKRHVYNPGLIYGGGLSLYLNPSITKKVQHSFNLSTNFESNNVTNFNFISPITNLEEYYESNAFVIQFGWRIQFYGSHPR